MARGSIRQGTQRRVTHDDIAIASGVSRATVSYVLNNTEGRTISASTQERVRRMAEELGHVPFAPARSLRLGRSNIVLALVGDFSLVGYVASRVLTGLDVALARRGYIVLVHQLDGDVRSSMELWSLVSPTVVVALAGLILPDDFVVDANTPVVRIHRLVHHGRAGVLQIEHLASRGHQHIGYATSTSALSPVIAGGRLAGAQRARERLGLPELALCEVNTAEPSTAFAALDSWLSLPEPPTAIAAQNDDVALFLTEAMAVRGLRAPEDLAVMGVDGIPSGRVRLTTVAIDVDAWVDTVVRRVEAALDGKEFIAPDDDFLRVVVRETA